MSGPANYIFLPWVQPGAAEHLPAGAADRLSEAQPGSVALPVRFLVNDEPLEKNVRLYGPGEVTGIDFLQVVRTEPRHLTPSFEPNYFPAIEFDRPDFPWLFTPAKGEGGRLRPWLCLVVVRKQPGVGLRPAVTTPLPMLEIQAPASPAEELPDLSESWAWAHAQVTGVERGRLRDRLAGDPARSVSRLLCPRRLDPETEYIACVVPTFELGRRAGLGLPTEPGDEQPLSPAAAAGESPLPAVHDLTPAWFSGERSPREVRLPVYYHWAFRTGVGGDFEELARRLLDESPMPPGVGKRPMDITRPGFRLDPPPPADGTGAVLGLEGALRLLGSAPDLWDPATRLPFQTELKRLVNTSSRTDPAVDETPVVGPPFYGRWTAAVPEVAATSPPSPAPPAAWPPPFWLDELNLDPRHRVAAGAGAEVVRRAQESLMASAWEQLGDLDKINQRRRQGQLALAVNNVYFAKTFRRFADFQLLKVMAPAQAHLTMRLKAAARLGLVQPSAGVTGTGGPVGALFARRLDAVTSAAPAEAVPGALRRLARPRGALGRGFARPGTLVADLTVLTFDSIPAPGEVPASDRLGETVWVEDDLPAGSHAEGDEPWTWVNANPAPYTGARCHQSSLNQGLHQHFFSGTPHVLQIAKGDTLFAYVHLDMANPPRQVMLQWRTPEEGWNYRAYWGENLIDWGVNGTTSRKFMGPLPPAGGWVRLEVPAAAVGLEGRAAHGMAFTLFGGRATWDRAGKFSPHYQGPITIDGVSAMMPANHSHFSFTVFTGSGASGLHRKMATADDIRTHREFRLPILSAARLVGFQPPPHLAAFRDAALAHHSYLNGVFGNPGILILTLPSVVGPTTPPLRAVVPELQPLTPLPRPFGLNLRAVTNDLRLNSSESAAAPAERGLLRFSKEHALAGFDPNLTITARVRAGASVGSPDPQTEDQLDPVMDAPSFPQPMYESLRELSPDFLLPGLERVPPDSAQLLQSNSRFIESFMVGLNHEMGRELLWRGYPTDQRGTYFRHFWDAVDRGERPDEDGDIKPIHLWERGALGGNALGGDKVVLLVRGELLRRYPNTVIYAVQALGADTEVLLPPEPMRELHPIFRGTLDPDVTFLGFDLRAEWLRDRPGYFFVFQQQPTEPRFGLDAAESTAPGAARPLNKWNDLSWEHMAPGDAHVRVGEEGRLAVGPGEAGRWGQNSAHMAYITNQLPVRVAIHSSQLLPRA